jgi:hypothetical protein
MAAGPPQVDLKQSILHLLDELDKRTHQPLPIIHLANRFGIKMRRLYDFINILSALGACKKSGLDHVIWLGRETITGFLTHALIDHDIDNPQHTLCHLFPVSACIGLSNLTLAFLMMFPALRTNHLDLRFVAHLFSLGTTRYKSTLCKLYQVSFILCAAEILRRTQQVCDVVLLDQYLSFQIVPPEQEREESPVDIGALLNRRQAGVSFVHQRRKEICDLFIGSAAGKAAMLPNPNVLPIPSNAI